MSEVNNSNPGSNPESNPDSKLDQESVTLTPADFSGADQFSQKQSQRWQAVDFTGSASEYFGIWISNLLLSISTLGVYSAWAKVRRETYFHNNTKIANFGFAYHAQPTNILRGRSLLLIAVIAIQLVATYSPALSGTLTLAVVLVLPIFINKALQFRARNTSYRNVRFEWHGDYLRTLFYFVLAPFIGFLSLGLLFPWIARHGYEYYCTQHSYGTNRFTVTLWTSKFYIALIIPTVALIGGLYVFAQILDVLADAEVVSGELLPIAMVIMLVVVYQLIGTIYRAMCRKLLLQTLRLGDNIWFGSSLNPLVFTVIVVTNILAVIASFGLLSAWAKIRVYDYLSSTTSIRIDGDLDSFIDEQRQDVSAFGEEIGEFGGFDVGA